MKKSTACTYVQYLQCYILYVRDQDLVAQGFSSSLSMDLYMFSSP